MEIWKDIKGYEGIYEVSDIGRVRSKEGKTTYTDKHGTRTWQQRIMKQKISKDKCHRIILWKDGKSKTWLVHILVAIAFLGDRSEEEMFINHKDGNRSNNIIENLEWCTRLENNNHAFDNDLMNTNTKVILEDKDTGEIIKFRSMTKASHFLGHKDAYISNLVKKNKYFTNKYRVYVSKPNKV